MTVIPQPRLVNHTQTERTQLLDHMLSTGAMAVANGSGVPPVDSTQASTDTVRHAGFVDLFSQVIKL